MWVKVDDVFPEHRKIVDAGRHLGRSGSGRVLAIWLAGLCYCNRNLTDGFIPAAILRTWTLYDRRPLDVAEVMVIARLFDRVEGGYAMHDYLDYQPSAEQVKAKRKRDLERKKKGKPTKADGDGFPQATDVQSIADRSTVHPSLLSGSSLTDRGTVIDLVARLSAGLEDSGAISPIGVHIPRGILAESAAESAWIPERSRARAPDPTRSSSQQDPGRLRRRRRPTENLDVLKALVWAEVRAGLDAGETAWSDLLERVKAAAARARLEYRTPAAREFLHDQFGIAMQRIPLQLRRRA